jgi:hypothetical protein
MKEQGTWQVSCLGSVATCLGPGDLEDWRRSLKACRTAPAARHLLTAIASQIRDQYSIEGACGLLQVEIKAAPLDGHIGLAYRRRGHYFIFIDPTTAVDNRPFVVAHEFCHHLLTLALRNGLPSEHEESLCDYFASLTTGSSRSVLSA